MTAASKSVVQVLARNCGGVTRTGSGFLWGNQQQIVTALHVIAGCEKVAAYFQGQGEVEAQPLKQLAGADLALLRLARASQSSPLKDSAVYPSVNDKLQAIGYYYGVPTLDNRSVTVTIGASTLQDMLTDALRQSIARAGSPDLNVRIVRLDGHLLPGLSGAPVINSAGEVAGIGSGGLESGAAGVSWAIAASYLKQLPDAPAYQPGARAANATHLFFSTEEGFAGNGTSCGELNFVRMQQRTVADLAPTSDNPVGLVQIASTAGLNPQILTSIQLDSYVDPVSGGSIALPAGAVLTRDGDMCRVSLSNGQFLMWIASARVSSLQQAQQVTLLWEQQWTLKLPFSWLVDPSFSYWGPFTRQADGLIINRRTSAGFQGYLRKAEAFETLMQRGNAVIGVVAVNREFNPPRYQQCLALPALPGCRQVNADYLQWAASVLGTFLSTFPPR